MKTPEQLKGTIRNIAISKHLHPQEVLQMFFFERILERLALSRFQNNFILKGGLLISSIIGISERTTMDMDTTVQGVRMEEKEITNVIKEILVQDANDNIQFIFKRIEYICEDDTYNNFRVHIDGRYGRINTPMKIDITTGDVITPAAIRYHYPCMFEDKTIPIMGYPLETILAEKFETIIRKNIATTRARDFYDLYTLYLERKGEINLALLCSAIDHTVQKRDSVAELENRMEILQEIREEPAIRHLWKIYAAENSYAGSIDFDLIMDVADEIGTLLQN